MVRTGFTSPSCKQISSCTLGVAVAVSARSGMFFSRQDKFGARLRYSGRKWCPQCDIQWASSIAISERCCFANQVLNHDELRRSGATNKYLMRPLLISCITLSLSSGRSCECKQGLPNPREDSFLCWSSISAISGLTIRHSPGLSNAGSW